MDVPHVIQNHSSLAISPERTVVLDLVETAFHSIDAHYVLDTLFSLENSSLTIMEQSFDLKGFERVFLVGFGKGSAGICKIIEEKLGDQLTEGYDIDVVDETFTTVHYTKGTHPLPSEPNIVYTKAVLDRIRGLTEKDLVLVVICGGGSVLFEAPHRISLETLTQVNSALLKSGATISEMNVLRKHLSDVKGGGLARYLYPATVASLIFSDVPGNDLSVIASAPTVKDPTSMDDVRSVIKKYDISSQVHLTDEDFVETPKEDRYFEKVHNILVVSNMTALAAMKKKAEELGFTAEINSDRIQGDAKETGKKLLELAKPGVITLFGGETTVKVTGSGKGGRNQSMVLASLEYLKENDVFVSFDSDGWDFYELAGAIGDRETVKKIQEMNLDVKAYLDNDDSYTFWEQEGDGIRTGKLASNVSDLMIVMKK